MDKIKYASGYGCSEADAKRGFKVAGDPEGEHTESVDYIGENPEDVKGGFLGRAKGWER